MEIEKRSETPEYSRPVLDALADLIRRGNDSKSSATEIVQRLLKRRPGDKYGGYRGKLLKLQYHGRSETSEIQRHRAADWLAKVRRLYDPSRLPELDGRLVIFGLALLDPDLAEQLRAEGFLKELKREIEVNRGADIGKLLTPEGQQLRGVVEDAVRSVSDHPAIHDQLGRQAFAQHLATRIRRNREEHPPTEQEQDRAFLLHIHGSWGAGKTSLLNFLCAELQSSNEPPEWIVVQFNAWQHQRTSPPWWWIMDAVYRQGVDQLSGGWTILTPWRFLTLWKMQVNRELSIVRRIFTPWRFLTLRKRETNTGHWRRSFRDHLRASWLQLSEFLWRLWAGWTPYLIAFGLFLLVISIVLQMALTPTGQPQMALLPTGQTEGTQPKNSVLLLSVGDLAKTAGAIVTLVVGLWAAALGVSRTLLVGSSRAASAFVERGNDPMRSLTRHFEWLIDWLDRPVAIFIDDLDRCNASFVVELLEGIQTLLRRARVVYVVAADRRWLRSSYETAYQTFKPAIVEPGHSLGYLFQEKTFQLSATIPQLSPDAQAIYLNHVLGVAPQVGPEDVKSLRRKAQDLVGKETSEDTMLEHWKAAKDNPALRQALSEEIAVRLADWDVEQQTEHALSKFARLLEPNPRAMKRFVNAYGVQRTIATLEGLEIGRRQLALWTVITSRWPLLAEHLAEHPKAFDGIVKKSEPPNGVEEPIRQLWHDPEVLSVLQPEEPGAEPGLDLEAIQRLAQLRS